MAKINGGIKMAWLKGMEAIGNTASTMANNAKAKMQEINLEARKRELLSELNMMAMALWQKGNELPPPLNAILAELNEVDEKLSLTRAQKYAAVETEPTLEDENADSEEAAASEVPEAAIDEAPTEPEAAEVFSHDSENADNSENSENGESFFQG